MATIRGYATILHPFEKSLFQTRPSTAIYNQYIKSKISSYRWAISGAEQCTLQNRNYSSPRKLQAYSLSVEEALYLAKAANVYTKRETQKQILTSPSFSSDQSPFLIENFFDNGDIAEEYLPGESMRSKELAKIGLDVMRKNTINNESGDTQENIENEINKNIDYDDTRHNTNENHKQINQIHRSIVSAFNPSLSKTFQINGREWLLQANGKGTRKRAVADVIIRRGSGRVTINNDEDIFWKWPHYYNRLEVIQPLYLTGTAGAFDVYINVRGGGISGQSGASRLALGRALVMACPTSICDLEKDMVLFEDVRQKLPKMPGRVKTRKAKSWSKR